MRRIALYVAPEEYAAIRALGACWDGQLKCWYIEGTAQAHDFRRWLGDSPDSDGADALNIRSSEAFVARATAPCPACGCHTEVVCIYCRSGTAAANPLERFTVQDIRAVDAALARQLECWPCYRADVRYGGYVNHCTHCAAVLPDELLHSEPDQPFHDLPSRDAAGAGPVVLTALSGAIRLSGDYSVEV